MPDMNI